MNAIVIHTTMAELIVTLGTASLMQDQALGRTAGTRGSQYPCAGLAGSEAWLPRMGAPAELPGDSQHEKDAAVQYNVDVQVTDDVVTPTWRVSSDGLPLVCSVLASYWELGSYVTTLLPLHPASTCLMQDDLLQGRLRG